MLPFFDLTGGSGGLTVGGVGLGGLTGGGGVILGGLTGGGGVVCGGFTGGGGGGGVALGGLTGGGGVAVGAFTSGGAVACNQIYQYKAHVAKQQTSFFTLTSLLEKKMTIFSTDI